MKLKIIIADSDKDYAERLYNALKKHDNLIISIFTEKELFEREITSSKYDIVLFTPDMFPGSANFRLVKLPMILSESDFINDDYKEMLNVYKVVNKYQSSEKILSIVLGQFSEIVSNSIVINSSLKTNIVAFYSPVGGCGKTAVSLACASEIADRGMRVLYMNLEFMNSSSLMFPIEGRKGIGELIGAIDGNINQTLKAESLVKKSSDNVLYFDRFENLLDIYEVNDEDISKLLSIISSSEICDLIIIDMNTSLNICSRAVLDAADKIILMERGDRISDSKVSLFAGQKNVFGPYKEKMFSLFNMSKGNEESAAGIGTIGHIPRLDCSDEAVIKTIRDNLSFDIELIMY
ncbi:MAG: AAA family ATPase [Huintestinicola sp.]